MASRRRSRSSRAVAIWLRVALACVLLVGLAAAAGLGFLVMGYPDRPGPGRGKLVEIELTANEALLELADRLHAAGLVAEPRLFALYAFVRGAQPRLREGVVLAYDDMSPRKLLTRVARGLGHTELRVVVPEGYTRFELAERLERFGICTREGFLAATEDRALLAELGIEGTSAEGYLFPDTYRMHDETDPKAVVRRMVMHGRQQLDALFAQQAAGLRALSAELGFGVAQVMVLASIVEEEAAVASERPAIAGVFLNRLRDPSFMPKRLQADPAVAYGCRVQPSLLSCTGFDGRHITKRMLEDSSNPYNTYRHPGLPPSPISSPGLSSVRAVLAPDRHGYLYFVASGGGRHAFSATLEDHNRAVQTYRQAQ